jgi:hypothetical protein
MQFSSVVQLERPLLQGAVLQFAYRGYTVRVSWKVGGGSICYHNGDLDRPFRHDRLRGLNHLLDVVSVMVAGDLRELQVVDGLR